MNPLPDGIDPAKFASAAHAVAMIEDGMAVGLGTGSTARILVDLLGARVRDDGLRITAVATSSATAAQATSLGIPLSTLDSLPRLDLTIDGADECDPDLSLIKGGGAALLQEKIVATSSDRMIVIADASKDVAVLGAFDLPIEIVRFGAQTTVARVAGVLASADVAARQIRMRMDGDAPLLTDEGHHILDLCLRRIGDAQRLDAVLNAVPGVVETGLFCGIAERAVFGRPDGSVFVRERSPGLTP